MSKTSCQKWIPCNEKNPTVMDSYIVSGKIKYSFEMNYEYFVDVAKYDPFDGTFNTWNDWYEGQDEYEIVAWMEMPKPWKEAEDETD